MMPNYHKSRWADSRFAQEYREYADNYIPERYRHIEITTSFYKYFLQSNNANKVLDLGAGDGIITHALLSVDERIEATLVDGSSDMLDAARQRLSGFENVHFVNAHFQDLLSQDRLSAGFDLIVSSLAIHHLSLDEKVALFKYIYSHLKTDGYLLIIDVVLSPTEDLEHWYLSLWSDWIKGISNGSNKASSLPIPQQYKDNPDNTPDTLSAQLNALDRIGFKNIDCYYKYGIFTIFGGKK